MTLTSLLLIFGGIGLALTLITVFILKKHKTFFMTFLQYFTGVWFVFSGWVKAIDPMGTAFKMEQYFAEFESTFSETAFSFISPIFPAMSNISIWFSVGMILFEIILGLMLIFGIKPKLTAWLFFFLLYFFTILTGFTFLTGYVPSGVNFFDFGSWSAYKATNMKVQDCGCFGDFLKLEPKISFFKDLGLMLPAIYFLLRHKEMHQLLNAKWSKIVIWGSTLVLLVYCLYNFVWNEPHIDFRPFKNGTDVAAIKEIEQKAQAEVQVLAFELKDKKNGVTVEVPYAQYMANLEKYSDHNAWEVVDQVKSEPKIKKTKISDFEITDFDGVDNSDLLLANDKALFMLTSPKVKMKTESEKVMVQDSVFALDTIRLTDQSIDTIQKRFLSIKNRETTKTNFIWPESFLKDVKSIGIILSEAQKAGHDAVIVIGGISKEAAEDLSAETGLKVTYLTADDILLKTIMRSNPGLVLWKKGKILEKWHKNQLESYNTIQSKYKL